MTTKRRNATMIRGIPEDLWRSAKAEAALEGKTLTAGQAEGGKYTMETQKGR